MTQRRSVIDLARDATTPRPAATLRVKARLRASLAEQSDATRLLRAVPEPTRTSEARVRARVQASWLSRAGHVGVRWGLSAAVAAALAVGLFAWLLGPGYVVAPGRPVAQGPRPDVEDPAPTRPPAAVAPSRARVDTQGEASPSSGGPPNRAAASASDRSAGDSTPRPASGAVARARGASGAVEELRTFGQAEADSAARVLTALRDALGECHARAGMADTVEISLAIEVDGSPRAVSVEGEEPEATRFRACAEPHLMGARFEVVDGVRAGAKEQITGGVIRFRFRGEP